MRTKQNPKSCAGFTLVELMVVIVIVAILATMGFLGGQRVLAKARESTAISNMRNVANGMFSIQADGGVLKNHKLRGSFPGESGYVKPGGNLYPWWTEVAENMGYGYHDKEKWSKDFVWTTDPNETAFHDPTADWDIGDLSNVQSRGAGSFWQTAHFGYNIKLGVFVNPWSESFQKGQGGYTSDKQEFPSKVRFPSDLIYVAQAAGSNGMSKKEEAIKKEIGFTFTTNGSSLLTPFPGGDGTPAVRIRGGANAIMSDGSARWINTKKLYEGSPNSPHFMPDSTNPRKDIYQ